ncbi:MAG: peptidoglycan editing factor PgeF [Gammaproteobacteria bacterium]|jgi:polyphenol oxidase|nr:peptidoglycan editing factor PgeF [Gammaproteobacteria bacterium]
MMGKEYIKADWSAPDNVHAFVSTKQSNVTDEFQQMSVQCLQQIHGTKVFKLKTAVQNSKPEADAIYTQASNIVCNIHTADCLPVFFCDQKGREIALAHAGWRGLAAGVLENTLKCFEADRDQIHVWLGPAIGPCHFEVGGEVRELFLQQASASTLLSTELAFLAGTNPGKWMADLNKLAQIRLNDAGVLNISSAEVCTYCDAERFYSYRREKETGRLSSLIWLL